MKWTRNIREGTRRGLGGRDIVSADPGHTMSWANMLAGVRGVAAVVQSSWVVHDESCGNIGGREGELLL